jgi:ubiquinone/menaquinone biosynthesis C-methylase UbiE
MLGLLKKGTRGAFTAENVKVPPPGLLSSFLSSPNPLFFMKKFIPIPGGGRMDLKYVILAVDPYREGVLMTTYLMEHPLEAERLELKTKREKILEELKLVPLRPGMDVLDVGCGTGAVTRILAEMVSPGKVLGIDLSEERLSVARELAEEQGVSNVEYLRIDVRDRDPEEKKFDLVYSRFLFQYLPEKDAIDTLKGMKRLVRPGGTVTIADLDGNHLYRYPPDEEWERFFEELLREVEKTGFDAFVGRKLYSMFRKAGFRDIQVNILPYYLIAGEADPTTLRVWEMKIQILEKTLEKVFGASQRVRELSERFMQDLSCEDTLFYNYLFLVQGRA